MATTEQIDAVIALQTEATDAAKAEIKIQYPGIDADSTSYDSDLKDPYEKFYAGKTDSNG